MGEDGQEGRHKLFRSFRSHHSRQCDRRKGNSDVFNRSMDTSDPILSSSRLSIRPIPKRKSLNIIADLLKEPDAVFEMADCSRAPKPISYDLHQEYFNDEIAVESEVVILNPLNMFEDPFQYCEDQIPVGEEIDIYLDP